jgi:hypothetical protein
MRIQSKILLGCLIAVLISGCAGYNDTMFMTKSNVGLDFDAKPPTAEINIARKEAVIAPSFEGGQTPPVMASFSPGVRTGAGFTSFFMGVDQTFAGGDAALAMAKLYGSPTATDKSQYNSAITISEAPKYKNWLQKVPGPGTTRPLIFGTDTALGLKVAWSGVGGQIPDTVKLGFNRKEFAWAPLSFAPTPVGGTVVDVKMPAFLATIESSQKVGGTGSTGSNGTQVSAMQYFATGDSATYLAMQRDVRAAMLSRMDPNNATYKARFGKSAEPLLGPMIASVYLSLKQLQGTDDVAKAFVAKLGDLKDLDIPASFKANNMIKYDVLPAAGTNAAVLEADAQNGDAFTNNANGVTAYLAALSDSVQAMNRAVAWLDAKTPLKISQAPGQTAADLTAADTTMLKKQLADQQKRLKELNVAISSNQDILAAFDYLATRFALK